MAKQGMEAVLEKLQEAGKRKAVLKRKRVKDGVPSRGPGAPRKKADGGKGGDKGGMTVIIGLGAPKKEPGGPMGGPMREKLAAKDDRIAMLEERIARLEAMLEAEQEDEEEMGEDEGEEEE